MRAGAAGTAHAACDAKAQEEPHGRQHGAAGAASHQAAAETRAGERCRGDDPSTVGRGVKGKGGRRAGAQAPQVGAEAGRDPGKASRQGSEAGPQALLRTRAGPYGRRERVGRGSKGAAVARDEAAKAEAALAAAQATQNVEGATAAKKAATPRKRPAPAKKTTTPRKRTAAATKKTTTPRKRTTAKRAAGNRT